jgi:pseudomonalisin
VSSHSTRRNVVITVVAVGAFVLSGVPAGLAATTAPTAAAVSTAVLVNDVLPGLGQATLLGSTAAGTKVEVGITLARPHPAEEATLKREMYTKGSSEYHHFLTPAQFDAEFGVPQSTYDSLRSWATRSGLKVAATPDSHDYLLLTGTAGQAEKTFTVTLQNYRDSTGSYFANANAPTVPTGDDVDGVIGLNSKLKSHTFHSTPAATAPHGKTPAQDSCDVPGTCVGLTTPQDLWSVYDQPTDNYGQGQSMAIFGEGQTDPVLANLRTFERLHKLPQIPVNVVLADGTNADYSDNTGEVEWDLDTQSSTGMSPEALGETLYFGSDLDDASVLNVFNTWADDPNGPLQASASYGECEENPVGNASEQGGYSFSAGTAYTVGSEQALTKAVMEGRTLFSSAGDTGSSCPVVPVDVNGVGNEAYPVVNYPASSPNAVAVGGTVLYTDGTGAAQTGLTPSGAKRVEEYSWTFTGGGTSVTFPKPADQDGITQITGYCVDNPDGTTATPLSTPCRGVPDIAAQSGDVASNGYGIVASGETDYPGGGTSLSSPLSLGMWTRIQAAAPAVGSGSSATYPGLGFAAATYYSDYAAHATDFFDIGGGTSSPPSSNGTYTSTPGWDYTSGLGVPDVAAIASHVDGKTAATNPELPTYPAEGPSIDPCAANLFTDGTGDDAYVGDPNGSGSNPQLDIVAGNITDNGTTLHTVLTIANLSTTAATAAGAANDYYVLWTYNGTQYFSSVEVDTTTDAITYGDGTVSGTDFTTANTDTGSFNPGTDGTVTVDVPLANVGSPATGDVLLAPAGQTRVLVGTTETGGLIEPTDVGGPQYDYQIGAVCGSTPSPSPSPTVSPTPTTSPSPSPSGSPTASPTPRPTSTPKQDTKAPTYTVAFYRANRHNLQHIVIRVHDHGSGIATISHIRFHRATWNDGSHHAKTFSPTVKKFVVKVIRLHRKGRASVSFLVRDGAGNVTHVVAHF